MKLLKNFRFICTLFAVMFMFSCSDLGKENINPTIPTIKKQEMIGIVEITKIGIDNEIYQKFITSENYDAIKSGIDNSEVINVQSAIFSRKEIGGLIITLSPKNGFQRDIMVTYNTSSLNGFYALLREHSIKLSNEQKATGQVNWFTINHIMLNEMKVEENRIVNLKIYNTHLTSKSSKTAGWIGIWECTNAQFNAYYQAAKNNCENTWWCDIQCNFSPCGVAYAAYAAGQCTKWVYFPDCTYSVPAPPIPINLPGTGPMGIPIGLPIGDPDPNSNN